MTFDPFRRDISWQRAVAVPIGTILSNGKVLLNNGVETPGVIWESPSWRLMDNGVILYKNVSGDGDIRVVKGVQYFGIVDEARDIVLALGIE